MAHHIHTIHGSISGKIKYPTMPYKMEPMRGLSEDQKAAMERIALDIFADMTNSGRPFQSALMAIYLSGAQHAIACMAEDTKGNPRDE